MKQFKNIPARKSFGIVCFDPGRCELDTKLLMVKHRNTYAFYEYVIKFHMYEFPELLKLFDEMTMDEKIVIMSDNYEHMWCRIFNNSKKQLRENSTFCVQENKYNELIDEHRDEIIARIQSSNTIENVWEFPKGRKRDLREPEIECALREFTEETGIPESRVRIVNPGVHYNYHDTKHGVKYVCIYYLAQLIPGDDIKLAPAVMNPGCYYEISHVKWIEARYIYNYIKTVLEHTTKTILNDIARIYKLDRDERTRIFREQSNIFGAPGRIQRAVGLFQRIRPANGAVLSRNKEKNGFTQ